MPASQSETSPTFEERARAAPLIYRFFNAAENCAAYLSGRWEGVGIQALHNWPADLGMALRLRCEIRTQSAVSAHIQLQLRAQPVRSRFLVRVHGASSALLSRVYQFVRGGARIHRPRPGRGEWQTTDAARYRAALEFLLDARATHEFGPDYARLRSAEWELTVQVLENVRAHVQLKRTDGVAPIYFSGVLRKVR